MLRSFLPIAAALLFAASACGGVTPPPSVAPRDAQPVHASFGRTWDAVIDVFAERNIPIKNMDRSSGFISSEAYVPKLHADSLANCGAVFGMPVFPDHAVYNVVVRGDSSTSTVKVTASFTQGGSAKDPQVIECSTKGVWESRVETNIESRAETKSAK